MLTELARYYNERGAILRKSISALTILICLLAGCAHTGELKINLAPQVRIPQRPVLILFADGVRTDLVDRMMDTGELPNIKRYIYDRGCRARYAVSCLPTITYAVTASITTGRLPGHHHIMGNKWFDRNSGKYQDYTFIRTYHQVDHDLRAPTIFEILNDRYTVTIQTANRLGAVRAIDNWMTSGINWFFRRILTVDQLVAVRFELIADCAKAVGQWPDLILAYFPAVDEIGHRFGADSPQYRHALINLDAQIGRIFRSMETTGMLDRYYVFFVSDHGHVPAKKSMYWSPEDYLARRLAIPMVSGMFLENASSCQRHRYLNKNTRIVVVTGGNRRSHIHLRTGQFWTDRPKYAEVVDFVNKFAPSARQQAKDATLMEMLAGQEAVRLVAARVDDNHAEVFFRNERAIIERRVTAGQKTYRYRTIKGDPLRYTACRFTSAEGGLVDNAFHDADRWLAASCRSEFPDFVPQIIEMFDSPRAGEIVLFADRGWDFSANDLGGHGSALKDDMIVPFVLVGPDIAHGEILTARLVDIVPTVLDILGLSDRLTQAGKLDGKSILPKVRHLADTDSSPQP